MHPLALAGDGFSFATRTNQDNCTVNGLRWHTSELLRTAAPAVLDLALQKPAAAQTTQISLTMRSHEHIYERLLIDLQYVVWITHAHTTGAEPQLAIAHCGTLLRKLRGALVYPQRFAPIWDAHTNLSSCAVQQLHRIKLASSYRDDASFEGSVPLYASTSER
jgi:hypothetical protein